MSVSIWWYSVSGIRLDTNYTPVPEPHWWATTMWPHQVFTTVKHNSHHIQTTHKPHWPLQFQALVFISTLLASCAPYSCRGLQRQDIQDAQASCMLQLMLPHLKLQGQACTAHQTDCWTTQQHSNQVIPSKPSSVVRHCPAV